MRPSLLEQSPVNSAGNTGAGSPHQGPPSEGKGGAQERRGVMQKEPWHILRERGKAARSLHQHEAGRSAVDKAPSMSQALSWLQSPWQMLLPFQNSLLQLLCVTSWHNIESVGFLFPPHHFLLLLAFWDIGFNCKSPWVYHHHLEKRKQVHLT